MTSILCVPPSAMSRDPTTIDAFDLEDAAEPLRAFLVVYHADRTRVVDLREGEEVTFGRSREATVALEDPRVSRRHAAVVRRGGALYVRDLGSRNGTRVNAQPVAGEQRLAPGDEVGIGGAAIVVGMTSRRVGPAPGGDLFADRLAAEVDRATRYQRRLALLMVHLEGPTSALAGARDALTVGLRRMDFLADYGPGELALVLPEMDRSAAIAAARQAQEVAAATALRLFAGVAVLPDHAPDAPELLERAREALRLARRGAGEEGIAAPPARTARPDSQIVVLDPAMQRVYELVGRVAASPMTVLLLGETGVGKEVVAEALHRRSPRAKGPFVRLNCASLPETLLESELFGYEKGAFTGAERRREGYFEAAAGGTLLLDEIGELPPGTQVKLLRVLETRAIARLGGTRELKVDVRVVAATNRDLAAEVRAGRFREDLFFRISAFTLHVPPLRDRRSEILPLAEAFAVEFARSLGCAVPEVTPAARARLVAYAWPGNVRELRNVIERAVVLGSGRIDLADLPDPVRGAAGPAVGAPAPLAVPTPTPTFPGDESAAIRDRMAAIERRAIEEALAATGGNQTRAAARLGLSRRALIYKMEKHGLKPAPGQGR
jgi:DNA-binding NtrC family response regulator